MQLQGVSSIPGGSSFTDTANNTYDKTGTDVVSNMNMNDPYTDVFGGGQAEQWQNVALTTTGQSANSQDYAAYTAAVNAVFGSNAAVPADSFGTVDEFLNTDFLNNTAYLSNPLPLPISSNNDGQIPTNPFIPQDYAQYANQMGIDVTDYSSLAAMGLDFGSLFGSDTEVSTGYEEFDTDFTNYTENSEENTATDSTDSTDNADNQQRVPTADEIKALLSRIEQGTVTARDVAEGFVTDENGKEWAVVNGQHVDPAAVITGAAIPVGADGQPTGQPIYSMVMNEGTENQDTGGEPAGDPMAAVEGVFADTAADNGNTGDPNSRWSLSDLYQSEFDETREGTVTGDHFQRYFGLTGEALANARAELADIANNVPVGEYGARFGINTEGMSREQILNEVYAMIGENYRSKPTDPTDNSAQQVNSQNNEDDAKPWNELIANNNNLQSKTDISDATFINEFNTLKNRLLLPDGAFREGSVNISNYKEIQKIIAGLIATGAGQGDIQSANDLMNKLVAEIQKEFKKFINTRNGAITFDFRKLIDKIANGEGVIHIAADSENTGEIQSYSKLVKADGIFEFRNSNQMKELLGKLKSMELYPRTLSFEGHSNGTQLWSSNDSWNAFTVSDITKYLDIRKFPKNSSIIFGQCNSNSSFPDLKANIIKQAGNNPGQLAGLTIYTRDHVASFNGAINNVDSFGYLSEYLMDNTVKKWYKYEFNANGETIQTSYPLPAYRILGQYADYIDTNKATLKKYAVIEEKIAKNIKNNQPPLSGITEDDRNLYNDSLNDSSWVEMRERYLANMNSITANYPVNR